MSPKGEIDNTSELPAQGTGNRWAAHQLAGEGKRLCNPTKKALLLSSFKTPNGFAVHYFLEVVGRSCYRTTTSNEKSRERVVE